MNVFQDGGAPIKSWVDDLEDGAREQIVNVSRLPFIIGHVALMPDAHQGYGMPIGGVFMADKAVVPYAIGVDIGCGVTLIETDTDRADVSAIGTEALLAQIARDIPVGNGPRAQHQMAEPFETLRPIPEHLVPILEAGQVQLGTLGGGNHFLELQHRRGSPHGFWSACPQGDGRIYFMIHSGSRSVGKKIADRHHSIALAMNIAWRSDLPHRELAWLPWETDEAKSYWDDMSLAMEWAEENRRRMAGKVISAFEEVLGAKAERTLDIHHNFASWENHFGKNGIVHRKGAVRSPAGERVLIPGSMSTGSYIAIGLGSPDAFESSPHGAGRARSRAATRKLVTRGQMEDQLAAAGVTLVTPDREKVTDESEIAYKDVDAVMAASADLVTPLLRLTPLGVVKG